MIVVDVTVLADFWVGTAEHKHSAQRLLEFDDQWMSIGLWRYELGSVFSKYSRAGRIPEFAVRRALLETSRLVVETIDEIDGDEVWNVSSATKLSYYDAAYVWLARDRKVFLYSRDAEILTAASDCARPMPVAQ